MAQRGEATLAIYDVAGRSVADLWTGPLEAGDHRFTWDGQLKKGSRAAAGIYFCRFRGAGQEAIRKLVLAR